MSHDLQRLKDLKRWTQAELAAHLGVTQGYVSRLLKGAHKESYKLKDQIARLLGEVEASITDEDLMLRVSEAASRSASYRQLLLASLLIFADIRS